MATKKRLIDAKFAQHIANVELSHDDAGIVQWVLSHTPTVDAVEVVHGEWVVCGDGEYVPFMCSACGKTTSWYHAQTANFCPNCGAKMDGGADNGI